MPHWRGGNVLKNSKSFTGKYLTAILPDKWDSKRKGLPGIFPAWPMSGGNSALPRAHDHQQLHAAPDERAWRAPYARADRIHHACADSDSDCNAETPLARIIRRAAAKIAQ